MRNRFIQVGRFGNLLLFIFLEVIAFFFIISFNNKQKSIFIHSSSIYIAEFNNQIQSVKKYFMLAKINESLQNENAALRQKLDQIPESFALHDTIGRKLSNHSYEYTSAEIISYTTSLRNNNMVINRGKADGLDGGMAVLGTKGIIGITKRCSEHFCSVLPIINSIVSISSKISSCDCYGGLTWVSNNPNEFHLNTIPKHVEVNVGDSVLTSGFSLIFPPDIYIGKVKSATVPQGSNFYDIEIDAVNDFYTLHYVYVVKNTLKPELDSLMKFDGYER